MGWCGVARSMRWRLPIWDDSTGVVFEAGLLPGVFYVGVGRHCFKDLRGW